LSVWEGPCLANLALTSRTRRVARFGSDAMIVSADARFDLMSSTLDMNE